MRLALRPAAAATRLHVLVAAARRLTSTTRVRPELARQRAARTRPRAPTRAPAGCLRAAPARWNAVERLGVGRRSAYSARPVLAQPRVLGADGRVVEARPRSSASARCCRPRPAARRCACPAGRPALPPAKRAACRPGAIASPPASTPISRTPASSTNASKMPIALLPPPTQATTASGSRPACVEASARAPRGRSPTGTRAPSADTGCGPSAEPSR